MDYLQPAKGAVIDGLEEYEVLFAEHQEQYQKLRVLRSNTYSRAVLSRWTLTPEQREAIASGADLFLELLTYGHPLQPIRLGIAEKPGATYWHQAFCLQLPGDEDKNHADKTQCVEQAKCTEPELEAYAKIPRPTRR